MTISLKSKLTVDAHEITLCNNFYSPYGYCASVSVPSIKLLPQWAFLTEAKYKGAATFNQMKVDVWTYNV